MLRKFFTPTATSQVFAGGVFWIMIWLLIFDLDSIGKLLHCEQYLNRNWILRWIYEHKTTAFIGTEVVNNTLHPPKNGDAVCFNLGGSAINGFMIGIVLRVYFSTQRCVHWCKGIFGPGEPIS